MYRIRYSVQTGCGVFDCDVVMNLPTEWAYGESFTLEETAAERLFAREYHRGKKLGEDGDFFVRGDAVSVIKLYAVERV